MCSSKFEGTLWRLAVDRPRPVPNATNGALPVQPLDNGYLGKSRKIAHVFYPSASSLDELERNSESFERKASDPKTFLSDRNYRNSRKTLCCANCG